MVMEPGLELTVKAAVQRKGDGRGGAEQSDDRYKRTETYETVSEKEATGLFFQLLNLSVFLSLALLF